MALEERIAEFEQQLSRFESQLARFEERLESIGADVDLLRLLPQQIARIETKLDLLFAERNKSSSSQGQADWRMLIERLLLFLLGAFISYIVSQSR